MKFLLLSVSVFFLWINNPQNTFNTSYSSKNGKVGLFFDLTVGQMNATTNQAQSTLDIQRDAILFNIKVDAFKFSNPILEQQFKEVYMEVDKYPETTFVGKIKQKLDFKNKAPQKVMVEGTLGMHGVSRPRTIPATMTLEGDKIRVISDFMVKASDHKIDIPSAFFANGKDEIKVSLDITYTKNAK
ncbi:MAG: YceI family protein [Microscillaceae bacterium]|jgi:polyisoprenoid-binding protein YceI|nr:YceI family protein [Microscillaceae bacterium]